MIATVGSDGTGLLAPREPVQANLLRLLPPYTSSAVDQRRQFINSTSRSCCCTRTIGTLNSTNSSKKAGNVEVRRPTSPRKAPYRRAQWVRRFLTKCRRQQSRTALRAADRWSRSRSLGPLVVSKLYAGVPTRHAPPLLLTIAARYRRFCACLGTGARVPGHLTRNARRTVHMTSEQTETHSLMRTTDISPDAKRHTGRPQPQHHRTLLRGQMSYRAPLLIGPAASTVDRTVAQTR